MENVINVNMYNQAVYDLSEFITQRTKNVEFKVSDFTTNSFKKFKEETRLNGGIINVSLEGSETSIYGNKYINTLARVWHDMMHLEYNLSFNSHDEKTVGKIQKEEVFKYFKEKGISYRGYLAGALIWIDIVEQVNYYNETGEFVENQVEFVRTKFLEGV